MTTSRTFAPGSSRGAGTTCLPRTGRSPSTSARSPSSGSSRAGTGSASASAPSRATRPRHLVAATATAVLAAAPWWRRNPSACPYGQRFWVEAPHPLITRERLRRVLAPRPGERVLEVGPGTGYYSLALAEWLGPDGPLELFDLQQEMLDHTLRRAGGLAARMNATQGDATALPYPDGSFDAVVLTCTLGEIPDQAAALRELAR